MLLIDDGKTLDPRKELVLDYQEFKLDDGHTLDPNQLEPEPQVEEVAVVAPITDYESKKAFEKAMEEKRPIKEEFVKVFVSGKDLQWSKKVIKLKDDGSKKFLTPKLQRKYEFLIVEAKSGNDFASIKINGMPIEVVDEDHEEYQLGYRRGLHLVVID